MPTTQQTHIKVGRVMCHRTMDLMLSTDIEHLQCIVVQMERKFEGKFEQNKIFVTHVISFLPQNIMFKMMTLS